MTRVVGLASLVLFSASASAAGFDWGQDCDEGSGEFTQYIPRNATTTVGEIPAGKKDVEILLESDEDVDVQLIDVQTGHQLIAWPNGDLNGATEECTTYQGVTYCYSGYNGLNGEKGHEYIRINGETNRPMRMKAFGYAAGDAEVTYSFGPVNTCNEVGSGDFSQYIPLNNTTVVGEIPRDKYNVVIELDAASGRDVDVQLWAGHTQLIAWPDGMLNGATADELEYQGMRITYSGYNGIGGDKGHERIEIWGRVAADLTMKAFGYRAGSATVDYEWGVGAGDTCGGIASLSCDEGLECKAMQDGSIISDPAGECHTPTWCASDETAAADCASLIKIPEAFWTCEAFECVAKSFAGEDEVCYHFDEANADAFVNIPCEPGLQCLDANPGVIGFNSHKTCQSTEGVGATCGGIAGLPCDDGLVCHYDGVYADAAGTCEEPVPGEGDFCGGIGGLQCEDGLICQLQGDYPDAGGTCRVPFPGEGDFCGGIGAIPCDGGLHCEYDGDYPDAGGTCQP